MIEHTFMSWSGGKDSALSLYKAQQEGVPVKALVTSVNSALDRVSMHGVKRELLQRQAASLALPLHTIELPEMPGMQQYEEAVHKAHTQLKEEGFTKGIFGDIFLEDLKQYREELLEKDGLACIFPIWKMDSGEVVRQFLQQGFKAIVVCVNTAHLDRTFCGRLMDAAFFNDLPSGVDLCGENGEYHSFVFDGPNFLKPVPFEKGEMVYKEYASPKENDDCFTQPQQATGFYFCDLLPV
jgi:uncharacterized protein (TIGR00290 family)